MKKIILTIAVLAALIAFAGCSGKQAEPEKGVNMVISPEGKESAPAAAPSEPSPAPEASAQAEPQPEMRSGEALPEIKCDERQTLGYIGCAGLGDKAELTIRNTGRADLDGVFIKFFDEGDIQVDQYPELFSMAVGNEKVLDIPLNNPRLWKVEVFPVTGGQVCGNKQLVVIPTTNCR